MICQSADVVWPTQGPDLFSRFGRIDISAILKHHSNDTWALIKGKERASLCKQVSAFHCSECLCVFYVKQNKSQIPERDRDVLAKARRCDDDILLVYACVLGESGRKSNVQTQVKD